MEVFEVIRLIGACVAFIVGTIVFMVLFFRGMSWIDVWVRGRGATDDRRRKARRIKESKQANRVREQLDAASEVRKTLPVKNSLSSRKPSLSDKPTTLRWNNGIGSVHVANRTVPSHANASETSDQSVGLISAASTANSENQTESIDLKQDLDCSPKTVSRIATVHLLTGETIERVAFCSKEKATKICAGIGFKGIVLEDCDGHICVVRESNIKMVTWKAQ